MKTLLQSHRALGMSLKGLPIAEWLLGGGIPLRVRPVDQTWVYQDNLTDDMWAHNPHSSEVQIPLHSSLHQWLTSDTEIAALNYRGRLFREIVDASESVLLPLALHFLVKNARGAELWESQPGQTLLYAYAWAAAKHASQIGLSTRTTRSPSLLQPERDDTRFLKKHAIAELESLGHCVDSPEFLFAALRPLWGTGMEMEQSALLRVPTLYRWLGKHLLTIGQLKQSTMLFTKSEMAPASDTDQVMLEKLCSFLHQTMDQKGLDTFSPVEAPTHCTEFDARFMDWTFASHYSTWTKVETSQALATRIYGLEFALMSSDTRIELEEMVEEDALEEAHGLLDELPPSQASDCSESRRSLILC